jgi:hypothetical protein
MYTSKRIIGPHCFMYMEMLYPLAYLPPFHDNLFGIFSVMIFWISKCFGLSITEEIRVYTLSKCASGAQVLVLYELYISDTFVVFRNKYMKQARNYGMTNVVIFDLFHLYLIILHLYCIIFHLYFIIFNWYSILSICIV